MDALCIACETVSPRQEALKCDGCNLWQHRPCGTGISRSEYRQLVLFYLGWGGEGNGAFR